MTIKELLQDIENINAREMTERLIARYQILDKCIHNDFHSIAPDSDKHLHINIIIDNNDETLAMAIVRQVALITHYPNFKEEDRDTRTIISIIYNNADSSRLKELLKKYTGNLSDYCQFIVDGKDDSMFYDSYKDFMPLDLAIEIIKEGTYSCLCPTEDKKAIHTDIRMSDIKKDFPTIIELGYERIYQSKLINIAYKIGADIDNLPAYDNSSIQRYSTALDYFFNHTSHEDIQKGWQNAKTLDKLSCLFCADCINERINSLISISDKTIIQYIRENKKQVIKTIEKNIDALALSEHSRWNIEKLILGFRPYTINERFSIDSLFGDEKKHLRNKLKKERIHIDLCSYKHLRRIDPGNIKYDYFLMLSIPFIIAKTHEL